MKISTRNRFQVMTLRISGQTAFTAVELLAVTGFKPGSALSLTELHAMAARITRFYGERGYFVAHAHLPAQDIQDGVVTIVVAEGCYGAIMLDRRDSMPTTILDTLGHCAKIVVKATSASSGFGRVGRLSTGYRMTDLALLA